MTGLRGGICENNFSDQGVIRYCRGVLFRGDRGGQAAKDDQQEFERMSGISSEVLRVSLGVFLPPWALVVHRVLQAVPAVCKRLRKSTCTCPKGTRSRASTGERGGARLRLRSARGRVPRAPVLVQVLESGQVSIFGCVTARERTPSKVVLSRPTSAVLHSPGEQRSNIRVSQRVHQEVQRLSRRVETELRRCPTGLRHH